MKLNRYIVVSALLALQSTLSFAGAMSGIGHALLHVMSKQTTPPSNVAAKDLGLIARHPGVMRAAEKLGRDLPEAEKKRAAEILERVLRSEYARRNVAMSCSACVSENLADALNARMIDIVKKHDDLMVKLATEQAQVLRLVDSQGKPLPTAGEYNQVVEELAMQFAPSMQAGRRAKTASQFVKNFTTKLKSNGAVDIEYDASGNALTATFKYGPLKVKAAKIDMTSFLSKAKLLIYGGGLATLGYRASDSEPKNDSGLRPTKREMLQRELLHRLKSQDREFLASAAETEYVMAKFRKISAAQK